MYSILDESTARNAVEDEFGPAAGPLLALLRPSLRIVEHEGARPPSVRLSGPGLLPAGASWPECQFGPLTFLAAIDCAAVHALLPESRLPASGTITAWVYRHHDDSAPGHLLGGASSTARDASRLTYYSHDLELVEHDVPTAVADAEAARSMEMSLIRDVMWPVDLYILDHHPEAGLSSHHVEFATQLCETEGSEDPDRWVMSRIGGWPGLEYAAEGVALVDAGRVDGRGYPDYRAQGAGDVNFDARRTWLPILQLGPDLDVGWNWFLDGILIFLGREGAPVEDAHAYCSRQ